MGWSLKSYRLRCEQPFVTAAAAAVVALAILPPLAAVGRDLFAADDALALLASGRLWWLLARSLSLSGVVTALALGAGVPLGVLFARANIPLRRLLLAAHVAIVFLPPFLPALGWFDLLGQAGLAGSELSAKLLFSDLGLVLVLTVCFTPVVTALTALGVNGVDASLVEAARIAAGPWRAAAFVLVPCAAPVIGLAGVVVFTLAFSELGVPMFLRVNVYPAVVFSRLGGMDFAPGEAAVYVLPLLLVACVLVAFERRFAGRRAIAGLADRGARGLPLFTGRPFFTALGVFAAVTSLAPLFGLLLCAANGGGFSKLRVWLADAPWNGLRASTLAAAIATALALVLGHALARQARVGVWVDGLATLAFILPSSVLGVGIVAAWNHPSTSWLYGSYAVLVVGFVARYTAVATRMFAGAVAQLPASFEEAAKSVGAGYLRRLHLVQQLAARGLAATFVLTLVFALRDLETAALFYPPSGEPLTVRIFTLEANGPPAIVAALALVHVAITLAAVSGGFILLRDRRAA